MFEEIEITMGKLMDVLKNKFKDQETLRNAQAAPDDNRDLLVRVVGYSDYFIDLDSHHQEEIIARTRQGSW